MMRYLGLCVLCVVFGVSISTGCGKGIKVGLVTDTGSVRDKGFNQSAWEGVELAAKELGLGAGNYKYIESEKSGDFDANIDKLIKDGHNVIVTVGFPLGAVTIQKAAEYPAVKFIGVDQFRAEPKTDAEKLPNYVGLIFPEDHGGYLAGALAALLSKKDKVAAVLGTEQVPPIVNFKLGFEAGARSIKPNIEVLSTYYPGGPDEAFSNPTWGSKTANEAIQKGADVIFAAAGQTGNGALETAATEREGGKEIYCIGVDVDQWETVKNARACLVSSSIKQISVSVSKLIGMAKNDTFPLGGNYNGSMELAPFHDFENKIDQSIKDKMVEIANKLKNGEIKISK